MITIHSAKGLEFDKVFVPDCTEGFLPVIGSNEDLTYDTRHPRRVPKAAEWIENERRLFYVGLTRARKEAFIGAPSFLASKEARPSSDKGAKLKFSRFLEEIELLPTKEIAIEVRRAATGDKHSQLVEKCKKWSSYHHIVRPLKEDYLRILPKVLRSSLVQVELKEASRPFRYRQEYLSPFGGKGNSSSRTEVQETQTEEQIW